MSVYLHRPGPIGYKVKRVFKNRTLSTQLLRLGVNSTTVDVSLATPTCGPFRETKPAALIGIPEPVCYLVCTTRKTIHCVCRVEA